ncbi:MAG: mersacidin/lichenicidin family type 2 lantibiotic, partial [Candidatus Eremiobacteraeota bacterium]|nr:mersacidin/lichenicidin family type 2 lantibiotic [Candidatus Eremiobacteraeota bacterium]
MVRAWRDPLFRAALPVDTLRELPPHPAGVADDDDDAIVRDITFGGGCGTAGCSRVVCTDPCT